jgi:hypothetical protein
MADQQNDERDLERQMPVALGGRGGLTRHRARARWHNDGRLGMALGDRRVHVLPVIAAVAGERGDHTLDLIEQRPDLGAIVRLAAGQLHRFDLAGGGVHAQVQLAPGTAFLGAVLLRSIMRQGRPA